MLAYHHYRTIVVAWDAEDYIRAHSHRKSRTLARPLDALDPATNFWSSLSRPSEDEGPHQLAGPRRGTHSRSPADACPNHTICHLTRRRVTRPREGCIFASPICRNSDHGHDDDRDLNAEP